MKSYSVSLFAAMCCLGIFLASCQGPARKVTSHDMGAPINPCLACHHQATPAVVTQWEAGMHGKVGVKCYVCHYAEAENGNDQEHHGFSVTAEVDIKVCESCHPENATVLYARYGKGEHP